MTSSTKFEQIEELITVAAMLYAKLTNFSPSLASESWHVGCFLEGNGYEGLHRYLRLFYGRRGIETMLEGMAIHARSFVVTWTSQLQSFKVLVRVLACGHI